MEIINVHIHTFKEEDVPRGFLPLGLVRLLSNKVGFSVVSKLINWLNPLSRNNLLKKYLQFASTGRMKSQEEIMLACSVQYPETARFCIHSMDMSAMNAGRVPREFMRQLHELSDLEKKYNGMVYPFVHIDPNNPDYMEIFENAMILGFKGVKIYPPASCFLPSDARLEPIFEYCNKNKIPVLAHCGAQSPTHYHDSKKNLRNKLNSAGLKWTDKMDAVELCGQFTHPLNWVKVIEKYPNINFCLAHWGSESAWTEYIQRPGNPDNWAVIIKDMLQKYPNCYTDISFTLNNQEYFSVLKVFLQNLNIRSKVLFGTDYYMVETKTPEKMFCFDLRAYLGEELFKAIAEDNPKKYLNI